MITGFLTIGILQALAVISPGPDFALVVKNTLNYSRRIGILTALGITSGVLFHLSYCLLGLAFIISKSLWLFNFIKYTGAAYLIYIGLKGLLDKGEAAKNHNRHLHPFLSGWTIFRQGLFCNMLNPKASLFFLGVFTLVIHPGTPVHIQLLYALEIMGITFLWFAALSYLLTHSIVQSRLAIFQKIITKLMGILLIFFGVQLALLHH
jgi:RhtB (resistance to homoserine/threonine) family protein